MEKRQSFQQKENKERKTDNSHPLPCAKINSKCIIGINVKLANLGTTSLKETVFIYFSMYSTVYFHNRKKASVELRFGFTNVNISSILVWLKIKNKLLYKLNFRKLTSTSLGLNFYLYFSKFKWCISTINCYILNFNYCISPGSWAKHKGKKNSLRKLLSKKNFQLYKFASFKCKYS